MNPLTRTLKALRDDGWLAEKVEMPFNPFSKVRRDLFGMADVLSVKGDTVLLVQATSQSNVSARVKKLTATPARVVWCASPNRLLQVWGWRKVGNRWKASVTNVQ